MKIKINFKKMKGFTLIELIVVIAIIGILTAVLVPSLTGYVNKARRRTDAANAKELYNELSLLLLDDTLYEGFNGKEETASAAWYDKKRSYKTVHTVKVTSHGEEETYNLHIVAKCAGAKPAKSQPMKVGMGIQKQMPFMLHWKKIFSMSKSRSRFQFSQNLIIISQQICG